MTSPAKLTLVPQTLTEAISEFESLLADLAANIIRLASLWRQIKELGGDMEHLRRRGGLIVYVALVGDDDMIPEAVVKFAGQIEHLRVLALLPPDRQRAITTGEERIPFFLPNNGGDSLSTLFEDIRRDQLNQVFDRHRRCFREISEQRLIVEAPAPLNGSGSVRRGKVTIDRRKKTVRIGKAEAAIDDALQAFRAAGYTINGA